jgi:outer membrane lipoprotein carrier protein
MTLLNFVAPRRWIGCMLALSTLVSGAVRADGLESLEAFLRQVKTGRAEFTQTVTSPARDGQAAKVRTSTGSFEFARPGRFRFDYRKPFPQVIVADGKTLSLYDPDLNQVTQRGQAQALGTTPAALLATTSDLRALEADFSFKSEPESEGLQWVSATPKARDGQLQGVRVGFRGAELAVLDIVDGLGQRSRLSFSKFESNPALPAGRFDFRVPAGADVLRQ